MTNRRLSDGSLRLNEKLCEEGRQRLQEQKELLLEEISSELFSKEFTEKFGTDLDEYTLRRMNTQEDFLRAIDAMEQIKSNIQDGQNIVGFLAMANAMYGGTSAPDDEVEEATNPVVEAHPNTSQDLDLSTFLQQNLLGQYETKLRELGAAVVADLADVEEDDLLQIGMKKLEIKRLQRMQ